MNSLTEPGAADQLIRRLNQLHEQRPRAWGRMTAHEMLCHLSDSFEGVMGERRLSPAELQW